jgi:hypothetical protein
MMNVALTAADRLKNGGGCSGRIITVEYQGPIVRVALETPSGEQASAILPDSLFFEAPVRSGESATFVWSERDIHYLQAGSYRPGPLV